MRLKRSQKNAMKIVGIIKSVVCVRLRDFFILRSVLHLFIHNRAGIPNTFSTLLSHGHDLAQLLDRFGLITAHDFTERFVTDGITQTDVHLFITRPISCAQCKCESFLFQTYLL